MQLVLWKSKVVHHHFRPFSYSESASLVEEKHELISTLTLSVIPSKNKILNKNGRRLSLYSFHFSLGHFKNDLTEIRPILFSLDHLLSKLLRWSWNWDELTRDRSKWRSRISEADKPAGEKRTKGVKEK